jgi:hypothetical protein
MELDLNDVNKENHPKKLKIKKELSSTVLGSVGL